ncbi:MAG: tetratricopeptide repeat protein [Bacteroidales bacterium]|nr:tetratricopeptide repeat protein [Bacteroidales bacterium]
MVYKFFLLLSIIIFNTVTPSTFAQNQKKIDSLEFLLKESSEDSVKINLHIQLSETLFYTDTKLAEINANLALNLSKLNNYSYKTATCYITLGIIKEIQGNYSEALDYLDKSLKIEKTLGNKKGISRCLNNMGILYETQGDYSKALEHYERSLIIDTELNDKHGIAICLINIGGTYDCLGEYSKALEQYERSLKISTELNDNLGVAINLNNIGEINRLRGNYVKALEYYEKSLKINEELNDRSGISVCLNNIGTVHQHLANNTIAIKYYKKSLKIDAELGDHSGQAISLNNIGEIELSQKDYEGALESFTQAILISQEIEDLSGIARSASLLGSVYLEKKEFSNAIKQLEKALKLHLEIEEDAFIANDYAKIGQAYFDLEKYEKAISYSFKAINISKKIGSKENTRLASKVLSQSFEQQQKFKEAYKYLLLFKETHDSIFTIASKEQLTNLETRFDLERKEKQIELQQTQLDKQDVKIQKQQIRSIALIGGFIAISVIIVLIIIGYMRIRKANEVITYQKEEIIESNEELNQTNEELRTTMETINKQKQEITDSIHYAKYIQNAILPRKEKRDKLLSKHFVYFKPKNIVSGDFYWTTEIEERTIVAAADCTGHGVPGAFMSMLGVSFLNEIVNKEYITHPGVILRRLRKDIINALQQKGEFGEQRDGMDIALCSIDFKNMDLQFSGANNPLYIIRDKNKTPIDHSIITENDNNVLYEIKGDRMPIAINEKMDRFKMYEFKLLKGDCLYLFSDGYQDQFGGLRGKKFMSSNFKDLLLANCNKPMNNQSKIIDDTINNWQNGYEQVDDILVIGIKI